MSIIKPVAHTIVPTGAVSGSTYDDHAGSTNEANAALIQAPGFGSPATVVIDSAGKLVPTISRDVLADTNGGASSDFLDFISLAAVPDGMTLMIFPANGARTVVLRHAMTSADTDAGTILLAGAAAAGDQLALDELTKGITVQRRGIGFYERGRFGFASGGSTIGQAAQDFGGFPVTGMRAGYRLVSGASDTLARGTDKGWIKQYGAAATVVLPDPNDQTNPDPNVWWQAGDFVLWEAGAASLIFRRWDGGAPANALGHDRAIAQYAQGWVIASPDPSSGSLTWVLSGLTDAPPGGGLQRVAYWSALSGSDLTLAATDTTTRTAASLTHPYGAAEQWLYLARAAFYGAGTASQSLAKMWGVMAGGTDVQTGHTLRPGFATSVGSYCIVWSNTFGGSPGSQTVRLDAANSLSGFSTVVGSPLLAALRLETDEDCVTDVGPHTDSAGTFVAAATLAFASLPADTYYIIYGTEWNTSAGEAVNLQISVAGTVEGLITTQRGTGRPAFYSGVTSAALSGSGSIILQVRRDAGAVSGTVTATNATIALLRKSRFQTAASGKSTASTSYTSSTPSSKVNVPTPLQAGWSSLVIGGAQCGAPSSAGSVLSDGQLTQSGSPVGPSWKLDVNATGGQSAPSSALTFGIVRPVLTTDVLDLAFSSDDGSTAVTAKDANVVALALKP